jgi:hypothetical protein
MQRTWGHRAALGAGGPPFRVFLFACPHSWMIPLQYINPDGLVRPFRLADPFGLKGSGFWAHFCTHVKRSRGDCKKEGKMVGASGFEPPASWSRTRRASQAALRPDDTHSGALKNGPNGMFRIA